MLSGVWQRGFDAAEAASLYSNGPQKGYKLGAALYSSSTLLSIGFNDWYRTSPWSKHSNWQGNLHAEIMALIKRRHYEKSNNLILYISRTKTNSIKTINTPGCSRPCFNCMTAIKLAGIKKIRFFDEKENPVEIKI
jgi:deoxycytidylate deaminase